MTRSGRVFAPKFAAKSVSQTTMFPKEKSMPTTLPQEKGESTFILTNTVATTAPLVGKDFKNKAAEANSKGKEVLDAEAQTESHRKNVSLEESQEFLRLI